MGENMIDWESWTDKNDFIKPRKYWDSSGNGILYSCIAEILMGDESFTSDYIMCFYKEGCFMRTPKNEFGQESFDDYLGFAVRCIMLNRPYYSLQIMIYAWEHAFVMWNEGPLSKAWLGRFPHVWCFMFAAAWPSFKWLVHLPLFIVQILQKPPVNDSSGTQLQWLFMVAYRKLYGENKTFRKWKSQVDMIAAFANYYDADHPFQQLIKEWK